MSTPAISPFSASISTPSSAPSPASGGPATTPYVSPFAAPVIKDVDPEEFSAANVPDPATERLLAGRSEVDEGQSMGKSEKEAPESKIRRFSEGMERFETRPDPEDSLKYTPEEKEKLAGVKGEVPPWWPKEPEKESYFYGAVQAIKKTGCSADDVHIAVERDYTGKDLTTEQKAILKAGWPGMEPYYMKREKYPEPARKEPYPTHIAIRHLQEAPGTHTRNRKPGEWGRGGLEGSARGWRGLRGPGPRKKFGSLILLMSLPELSIRKEVLHPRKKPSLQSRGFPWRRSTKLRSCGCRSLKQAISDILTRRIFQKAAMQTWSSELSGLLT